MAQLTHGYVDPIGTECGKYQNKTHVFVEASLKLGCDVFAAVYAQTGGKRQTLYKLTILVRRPTLGPEGWPAQDRHHANV